MPYINFTDLISFVKNLRILPQDLRIFTVFTEKFPAISTCTLKDALPLPLIRIKVCSMNYSCCRFNNLVAVELLFQPDFTCILRSQSEY